jgi:hypothetical protein
MHISPCELAGVQSKLSLRLQGFCNEKQVLLLVHSGSTGSFIMSETAKQLCLPTEENPPVHVIVRMVGDPR